MRPRRACLAALALLLGGAAAEPFEDRRDRLLDAIDDYSRPLGERPNPAILQAMRSVPRHLLVPEAMRGNAYDDRPLPIGEGQTISQPGLVAMMTHLLEPEPGDVMLEVGTGSGYQAAVLSRLVEHVYTIEIVEPLAKRARRQLADLGYENISVRHGDGYAGWPKHAPFDGIVVTAGAPHVPQPLVEQLKPGARMVIPVGPRWGTQQLMLISKDKDGKVRERVVIPVRFVPLTRADEQER